MRDAGDSIRRAWHGNEGSGGRSVRNVDSGRARTARPANAEASIDLRQRRAWNAGGRPIPGDPDFERHVAQRQHGDNWYDSRNLEYQPGPHDIDWRNTDASWRDAIDEAFNRTGIPRDEFTPTSWGRDIDGKSFPSEWQGPDGAEISVDLPHINQEGPDVPHVGWQVGRRATRSRGHIFLDWVPFGRPPKHMDR